MKVIIVIDVRGPPMPAIDVTAPADLFPTGSERQLAQELTEALLTAEGAPLAAPYLENTAAYIHLLPSNAVHTAGTDSARTVRVQVLTPPDALDRAGQQKFVTDATEIVTRISGDPTQAGRTWVFLTEAAEGGWGVSGFALGKAEFAALRGA
jgi:phenylpyruvate tautomerase PptA (4-oxalocrotonate tautomerase family)